MNTFRVNPFAIAARMTCPYCGAPVDFKPNEVIYRKTVGTGWVYICARFPDCDSYVGIQTGEDYGKPLGTLANKNLRDLRKSVYRILSPYWHEHKLERTEVYQTIAKILNKDLHKVSVAQLNASECVKVLNEWFEYFAPAHMLPTLQKRS